MNESICFANQRSKREYLKTKLIRQPEYKMDVSKKYSLTQHKME